MKISDLRATKDSHGEYTVTDHGQVVGEGYFASAKEAKQAVIDEDNNTGSYDDSWMWEE